MKILLTGFDPFDGESTNPAYEAIKLMPDTIKGSTIIKVEIPTVFGVSVDRLKASIDKHQPDVVICVGQAGGRIGITPEVVAINLDEARIADNEGNTPSGTPIDSSGENAYFTTLPVKAIVKNLQDNHLPSQLSYSAGTYVCNHLFYGLMNLIKKDKRCIRGGFIHVPYSYQQVCAKKNTPAMSIQDIAKGLEYAVVAVIENDCDIKLNAGTTH